MPPKAPDLHGKHATATANGFKESRGLPRDRFWLLPSNRKLRALRGISLRNLALSPPPSRLPEEAIDDTSIPSALQTPTKTLAQRDTKQLHVSRSCEDLQATKLPNGESKPNCDGRSVPIRPGRVGARRRSTLNWTNAPPNIRQQKLEHVAAERMADTWFSLHVEGRNEPIYVSEVVEKAMNPTFNHFDLNVYGPSVTRREELVIRYWAKTEVMERYRLLMEVRANLRFLHFVGKTIESSHYPLPYNSLFFHLSDGVYRIPTDLDRDDTSIVPLLPEKKSQSLESTSSFDSLMRLANLDDCVQDALSTREKLSKQIEGLIREQHDARSVVSKDSQARQSLASTKISLAACQRQLRTAKARRSELQTFLESRRTAIQDGQAAQKAAMKRLDANKATLPPAMSDLRTTREALSGQVRRICEDLLDIYPIESIDPKSLSYSVRGLRLPNANQPTQQIESNAEVTAAALGIVAHLTELLSHYLSIPLPYPPTYRGSTSTIYDPISNSMPSATARTFPLFQKAAVAYRYEYGVFLLNTDIELLMSRQGARMVDLRHTLPNLKYVLTVLTAGEGALPTRKRGGVKGLANGQVAAKHSVVGFAKNAEQGLQIHTRTAEEQPG